MKAFISLLAGDGIGPEVTAEAVRCLEVIGRRFGHDFQFEAAPVGGIAIDQTGSPPVSYTHLTLPTKRIV